MKLLELGYALRAHASGDVVGGAVVAEEFELVGLGVGERDLAFGDVGDEGLGGAGLVGDDDEVVEAWRLPLRTRSLKMRS